MTMNIKLAGQDPLRPLISDMMRKNGYEVISREVTITVEVKKLPKPKKILDATKLSPEKLDTLLATPMKEFTKMAGISRRVSYILNASLTTRCLGQLTRSGPNSLQYNRGMGTKSLEEIESVLKLYGLQFDFKAKVGSEEAKAIGNLPSYKVIHYSLITETFGTLGDIANATREDVVTVLNKMPDWKRPEAQSRYLTYLTDVLHEHHLQGLFETT